MKFWLPLANVQQLLPFQKRIFGEILPSEVAKFIGGFSINLIEKYEFAGYSLWFNQSYVKRGFTVSENWNSRFEKTPPRSIKIEVNIKKTGAYPL